MAGQNKIVSATKMQETARQYAVDQQLPIQSMMPDFITDPELRKGPKNQCTVTWMNEVQQIIHKRFAWYHNPAGYTLWHDFGDAEEACNISIKAVIEQENTKDWCHPPGAYMNIIAHAIRTLDLLRKKCINDEGKKKLVKVEHAQAIETAVQLAVNEALATQKRISKRVSFSASKTEEQTISTAMALRNTIINTSITRIDELREDTEMKHSRLLCELQELREQLLELPISNVIEESGKETRRISNLKEGSVVKVTDDESKSNRRKEWERTKWRLGSLVRRH